MNKTTELNIEILNIEKKIKPLKHNCHILENIFNVCCSVRCKEICLKIKKNNKERFILLEEKHESLSGHATKKLKVNKIYRSQI